MRAPLTANLSVQVNLGAFAGVARPAGRLAGRVGIPQEPALARPARHPAGRAGPRGLRPAQDIWLAELLAIGFPNLFIK